MRPSPERVTLREFFANKDVGYMEEGKLILRSEAWRPKTRIDFGGTSRGVREGIAARGGEISLRRTVDIDGYFLLVSMEKGAKMLRDGMQILFRSKGVKHDKKCLDTIQELLRPGEIEPTRFIAMRLGDAKARQGRTDTKLYIVVPAIMESRGRGLEGDGLERGDNGNRSESEDEDEDDEDDYMDKSNYE